MRKISKSKNTISYNMTASIFSFHPLDSQVQGVKPKSEKIVELVQSFSIFLSPFLLSPIYTNSSFTFTGQCKLEYLDYGNLTSTQYVFAGEPSECDQYNYDNGSYSEIISQPVYNYNVTFGPSDGLINAASSLTWPGATNIIMPGSNHGQMKNDGNTRDVLNRIYNAGTGIDLWWFTTPR